MRQRFVIPASLMILASIFLFSSCCQDCPPCPTCPQPPEPGSYYVYISDSSQDPPEYIWVVDSKTDSLIDSISTPDAFITSMDASPDGEYLATYAPNLGRVLIYDTDTKDTITSISLSGLPRFTPDNANLLILSGNAIYKYSTSNWALLANDTVSTPLKGLFKTVPYVFGNSDGKEYSIYNYETMSLVKTDSIKRADGSTPQALEIETSSDDKYFYFTARPNKIFKFEIETDSIVDSVFIVYGAYHGYMKCTPNGEYLLLTESTQWPDHAIGNLLMVDQENFTIFHRITTWDLNPYFPGGELIPGKLAVTPDGSKAFCGNNEIGDLPPVSFNLLNLSASNIKGLIYDCNPICVAVGKEIKK